MILHNLGVNVSQNSASPVTGTVCRADHQGFTARSRQTPWSMSRAPQKHFNVPVVVAAHAAVSAGGTRLGVFTPSRGLKVKAPISQFVSVIDLLTESCTHRYQGCACCREQM
jgi:hypothetical protein